MSSEDDDEVYRKLRVSLRVTGLEPEHVERLRSVPCPLHVPERAPGVVWWDLGDEPLPLEEIQAALSELEVEEERYGIWVSLVTEADHDGVALPEEAVRALRLLGGRLDFSFTVV